MSRLITFLLTVPVLTVLAGCSSETGTESTDLTSSSVDTEVPAPAGPAEEQDDKSPEAEGPAIDEEPAPDVRKRTAAEPIRTEEELRAALKAKNPKFGGQVAVGGDGRNIMAVRLNDPGIEDISPLAGLPLLELDLSECHITDIKALRGMSLRVLALEKTGVEDIRVLEGMPLEQLWLARTQVTDLSPLEGAPLTNLNLLATRVTDLGPLAKMPRLKMLWLNDTPVEDIGPLATLPLESLTLAGTKVSDLGPLKGSRLQRLHIARSEVTDLSPLAWMSLTRLVFTPSRIEKGIDAARRMRGIREIGTSFGEEDREDALMPPRVFWEMYDAGEFK